MKKLYIFFLLSLCFSNFRSQTVPTCSLDPAFIALPKYGIWPDSVTNFIQGTVGVYYQQNITVKVPKDTVQNPVKICFTRFELLNPTGYTNYNLPPGLSLVGTPSNLKFPGNANNCAVIYGTPTTAGTYTVHFRVDAFGNPILVSQTCPATPNPTTGSNISTNNLNYYIIKINAATGIKDVDKKTFDLQNYPNPVAGKTTIKFIANDEANAKISVHNTLGAKVFETSLDCKTGTNEYVLNTDGWNSGMYFYTVKYKNYSETKRMILCGNR